MQIKYLRVPDALLDSVKEDQMRMREAGRRGGPGARGSPFRVSLLYFTDFCFLIGRGSGPRGTLLPPLFLYHPI